MHVAQKRGPDPYMTTLRQRAKLCDRWATPMAMSSAEPESERYGKSLNLGARG